MSRELRLCPGVGGRKCGAFLSSLDSDPHPTCSRCRGRICPKYFTCDICKDWSLAQWEAFAKRKRSFRPSGSLLPPAATTSPRAETSSEVAHAAAPSSSSSLPSEGRGERGGLGVPLVLLPVELPLLPLAVLRARGVEVSLVALPVCAERSSGSTTPLEGVRGGGEDPGAARSRRSPVARSPRSLLHAP